MQKLGNLVNIKTGKLDANASTKNGEYPFFTCAVKPLRINNYAYDCECTLVAGNGDLNVKYYNGKFNAYQRVYIIESKDKSILDTKFLALFLDTCLRGLRSKTKGAVIKFIRLGDLTGLRLKLPPLDQQIYIANLLSKTEKLITQRKESITLLDEHLKSTFSNMFDNPVTNRKKLKLCKLVELTTFLTSGGRGWGKYYSQNGERFIRSLDVQMNYISIENAAYVVPPNNQEAVRTRIEPLDILLTITGSKIGRVSMVPEKFGTAYISQHVALIRTKNINPLYLSYYLSDVNCGQHIIKNSFYGQTKPGLNFKQIENFDILVPTADLQNSFVQIVEKSAELKTQYQQSLQDLENLFGSLSQMAFLGKLNIN